MLKWTTKAAKAYLKRIRRMDEMIRQRQHELMDLSARRTSLRATDYSSVRVQTSPDCGSSTAAIDRIVDLEAEIARRIERYTETRHKIIDMIEELDVEYSEILYRRYVEYKSFEAIACDLCISYSWAVHMHGEALRRFSELLEKDDTKKQDLLA